MNVILDIWIGFIKLLEYFDKKINGTDSSRFQDCFMKVKIVDFSQERSETLKRIGSQNLFSWHLQFQQKVMEK